MNLKKLQLLTFALVTAGVVDAGRPRGVTHQPCERRVLNNDVAAPSASSPAPVETVGTIAPAAVTVAPAAVPVAPSAVPVASGPKPLSATYSGDYTNFPTHDQWLDFETMWNGLLPTITSTSTIGAAARMKISIVKLGAEYHVDPRLLLGMIMAESRGDVGAPPAADGQPTPGLMQCWNGPSFPGNHDLDQAGIDSMVRCGAAHFAEDMAGQAGAGPLEAQVYQALRSYNSGALNVNPSDLNDKGSAGWEPYVGVVAKYLTGQTTN